MTGGYVVMAVLAAIFGGGGLYSYLLIKPQAAKMGAETAASLSTAAAELIEPLRRENHELRDRVGKLEQQQLRELNAVAEIRRDRDRLFRRVGQLERVLEANGISAPSPEV